MSRNTNLLITSPIPLIKKRKTTIIDEKESDEEVIDEKKIDENETIPEIPDITLTRIKLNHHDVYGHTAIIKQVKINKKINEIYKYDEFTLNLITRLAHLNLENKFPPINKGYIIIEDVIDWTYEEYVSKFIEKYKNHNPKDKNIILEQNPDYDKNPKINKRKQLRLQVDPAANNDLKFLVSFHKAMEMYFPLHYISNYVFIESSFNSVKQKVHSDYNNIKPDLTMPYACLIAIQDGTSIVYYDDYAEHEIDVPKFGCILFCGDTRHSGNEYSDYNARIHCYLDSDNVLHSEYTQDFNIKLNYNVNYDQTKNKKIEKIKQNKDEIKEIKQVKQVKKNIEIKEILEIVQNIKNKEIKPKETFEIEEPKRKEEEEFFQIYTNEEFYNLEDVATQFFQIPENQERIDYLAVPYHLNFWKRYKYGKLFINIIKYN